jgi:hypothetical protein
MSTSPNPGDHFAIAVGLACQLLVESEIEGGNVSQGDIARAASLRFEREDNCLIAVESASSGPPEEIARFTFPATEADVTLAKLDTNEPFEALVMALLGIMARAVTGRRKMSAQLRRHSLVPDVTFTVYVEHGCTQLED